MGERLGPRPSRSERGAVLVETAIFVVLLTTLISGVVRVASTMGATTTLDHAARSLARASGASSPSVVSDTSLLMGLAATLADAPTLRLQRLVVFRPQPGTGDLPSGCDQPAPPNAVAAGVAGVCNIFGPAHLAAVSEGAGPSAGCASGSWEAAWCPATREHNSGELQLVGIRIEAELDPSGLGVLSSGAALTATAVAALDPRVD